MVRGDIFFKNPPPKDPSAPTGEMIRGYLEALEADADEVLRTEFPFDTDPDRINRCIITEVQGIQIK